MCVCWRVDQVSLVEGDQMVSYNWQWTRELNVVGDHNYGILINDTICNEWESCATIYSLCFLNPHPPVSCRSSPQLTLPEGTQPRWRHTLTCCRMGESRTHATTFGGSSHFNPNVSSDYDHPKLADTTVLEFGEQNTFHCTIYWVVCSLTLSYCTLRSNWLCVQPPVSLVCVAQLLTCNLHCYNVYWLCIRDWLIQLLHHFINLIPRPFSCPALVACGVTDWMAWKNLSNTGVNNNCPIMVSYVCGSHC